MPSTCTSTSLITPTDRLARFIDRAFARDFFGRDFFPAFLGPDELSTRSFMPPVDIRETPEALVVHVDLPGMSKEDVNITLESNVLTLSGERKLEKETKEQDWHRVERTYGSFSRSFSLPSNVETEKVDAQFKDGVLTIHLPKHETARPRKVAIK